MYIYIGIYLCMYRVASANLHRYINTYIHVVTYNDIRMYQGFNRGGGDLPKGGGVTLTSKKTKILGKNRPKRPMFGAEGAENFFDMRNLEEFQKIHEKFKFIQEKI